MDSPRVVPGRLLLLSLPFRGGRTQKTTREQPVSQLNDGNLSSYSVAMAITNINMPTMIDQSQSMVLAEEGRRRRSMSMTAAPFSPSRVSFAGPLPGRTPCINRRRRDPSPYALQRAVMNAQATTNRPGRSRPRSSTVGGAPPVSLIAPSIAATNLEGRTQNVNDSSDGDANSIAKTLQPTNATATLPLTSATNVLPPMNAMDTIQSTSGANAFQSTGRPRASSTWSRASVSTIASIPKGPDLSHLWCAEREAAKLRAKRAARPGGLYKCPKHGCNELFPTEDALTYHMVFEMADEKPSKKASASKLRVVIDPKGLVGKAGRGRKGKAKEN